MEKQQLLDKLESLIGDCHQSIQRLRSVEDEEIPAIEIGLLEQKLITLYDQVQHLKGKNSAASRPVPRREEESTPEEIDSHTDDEITEILEDVEKLRFELEPDVEEEQSSDQEEEEFDSKEEKIVSKENEPSSKTPEELNRESKETEEASISKEETGEKEEEVSEKTAESSQKEEAPKIEKQEKRSSVNERYGRKEPSLHEKLAQSRKNQEKLSKQLSGKPVKDLKKAISVNLQHSLIKELFKNDRKAYKKAIDFVNKAKTYSEAKSYMEVEVMPQFDFKEDHKAYRQLLNLVKRKFI